MRYAIIDLGSNTVRMSCYDETDGEFMQILSEKELIGLVGYTIQGVLSQDGIYRIVETIRYFNHVALSIQCDSICCFATAGLRNIQNTGEVIDKVKKETGVDIVIISGEEEARLDFSGAFRPSGISEGLVVDMGGASTEIIRYTGDRINNLVSLPFGSLYLYKRFVSRILPDKKEIAHIRHFVEKQLSTVEWLRPGRHIILIGGTSRAIARLHREVLGRETESLQGYPLEAEDFSRLLKVIDKHRKTAVREILRVAPERIHTIMPGLAGFTELVRAAGAAQVSISQNGVREGYIREHVKSSADR